MVDLQEVKTVQQYFAEMVGLLANPEKMRRVKPQLFSKLFYYRMPAGKGEFELCRCEEVEPEIYDITDALHSFKFALEEYVNDDAEFLSFFRDAPPANPLARFVPLTDEVAEQIRDNDFSSIDDADDSEALFAEDDFDEDEDDDLEYDEDDFTEIVLMSVSGVRYVVEADPAAAIEEVDRILALMKSRQIMLHIQGVCVALPEATVSKILHNAIIETGGIVYAKTHSEE